MKTIEQLESEIRHHNHLYWDLNAPKIPDQAFDTLVRELKERDPDNPVLVELGERPTTGSKFTHKQPMLSLDKSYEAEGILHWWSQSPATAVVVSHKVDGLAASLHYNDHGFLTVATTRGNGRVGDVITENVKQIEGVPFRVPFGPCEVRGEVYMPLDTFNERYRDQFANPRNLAAGATKQKDPAKTRQYGIRFLAYDVTGFNTVSEGFHALSGAGFDVVPFQVISRQQDLITHLNAMQDARFSLNFEVDGIVFKFDDLSVHDKLGVTSHHPRYAIAYKYQGDTGETTLRGIEWSVSRTGSLNPVAVVDPISLSGVTVTRVSLHNLGVMEKIAGTTIEDSAFPLSSGARIQVTRRGGVIPHIEGMTSPGQSPFDIPDACPHCEMPTRRERDLLIADHASWCVVVGYRKLIHYTSSIDLQGIGPKIMEQLWDADLVRTPDDLYRLTEKDVRSLERQGSQSAQNIITEIQSKTHIPLDLFLRSLGIEALGRSISLRIANIFKDLNVIRSVQPRDLSRLDGVGTIMAKAICDGLKENSDLIDRLLEFVTLYHDEPEPVSEGPLTGESFVFTGAMGMKRSDAQAKVSALGAETPSAVNASTTYLVLGNPDYQSFLNGKMSSKTKAAVKMKEKGANIRIISESIFIGLLDEIG